MLRLIHLFQILVLRVVEVGIVEGQVVEEMGVLDLQTPSQTLLVQEEGEKYQEVELQLGALTPLFLPKLAGKEVKFFSLIHLLIESEPEAEEAVGGRQPFLLFLRMGEMVSMALMQPMRLLQELA